MFEIDPMNYEREGGKDNKEKEKEEGKEKKENRRSKSEEETQRLSKRGRGRPRLDEEYERESGRVVTIKKWTYKHEVITRLVLAGMKQTVVAKKFGISPIRVNQIMATQQARAIEEEMKGRMREYIKENIQDKIVLGMEMAIDRVNETLSFDEFPLGSDAKKHQDNLGLGLLKAGGALEKDEGEKVREQLPSSLAQKLLGALNASNEADRIREEKKEIKIDDADIVERKVG